ncbi:hypothetical protein ACFE04_017389 [Oxalis oulophora]
MRNVFATLHRHNRRRTLASRNVDLRIGKCMNRYVIGSHIAKWQYCLLPAVFSILHRYSYSTGFTSVHGERPSAEYAKLRKESLETQFGHVLGAHGSKSVSIAYHFGPFLAIYRASIISYHVFRLGIWQLFVRDMQKRAIKLGQALGTRPDILPKVYCQELAKLQDQIPPFSTKVAIKSIEAQLGVPLSQIFADISPEPIAAASLGQVYKVKDGSVCPNLRFPFIASSFAAHLHSGELVAVKVQRPGVSTLMTLDALLFNMIGGQLKRFANAHQDLLVAVNEVVRHMFDEIDYVLEGKNAERFALHYGNRPSDDQATAGSNAKQHETVKVPKIYWDFTRTAVLTMEWIDGIKLTNAAALRSFSLDRRVLIDQGVYSSLRQLLEVGFFHADPHPGNLVATKNGTLAYFDFGMMGDIPRHYRVGLIKMLVHFVNRDSFGLANDFLSLGFVPDWVDIQSVADALQGIMSQLYDVMYEFNFTLPPDYALVIRALGSLEGTAKVLDPGFKVIESAYPFVIGRLLADPSPDMRRILRELLIYNDGSIRWNRLERLITAISERASESNAEANDPLGWKSFDMRAVVSATEDLLLFIVSEKGVRIRVFLLRDIIKAADAFLEDEFAGCITNEKTETQWRSQPQGGQQEPMLMRVVNGFRSFSRAVKLSPQLWTTMFLRLSVKREIHTFSIDIISALAKHSSHKSAEVFPTVETSSGTSASSTSSQPGIMFDPTNLSHKYWLEYVVEEKSHWLDFDFWQS